MKSFTTKAFEKQYRKLPRNIQKKFGERVDLLLSDPHNRLLNIHKLHGKRAGYFSVNVTSDFRALFVKEGEDTILFREIGTHSQLYG